MKDQEKEEAYLDNHKSDISMEELLRIDSHHVLGKIPLRGKDHGQYKHGRYCLVR